MLPKSKINVPSKFNNRIKYEFIKYLPWAIKGICTEEFVKRAKNIFLDFMYVFFKMEILNLTQKRTISEVKKSQKRGGD